MSWAFFVVLCLCCVFTLNLLFCSAGHELHEQAGRKRVCGLQQCHVSAAELEIKTDFLCLDEMKHCNVFDRFLVYETVLHLWGESQVSQQLPGSVWVHVTWFESHHEINLSLLSVWLSFQSERESGDRNFAIGYYLKEKKVRLDAADNWAGIFLFKRKFFFLLWTHYICNFILSIIIWFILWCLLVFLFSV